MLTVSSLRSLSAEAKKSGRGGLIRPCSISFLPPRALWCGLSLDVMDYHMEWKSAGAAAEEEVDPLDAFMAGVQQTVKVWSEYC